MNYKVKNLYVLLKYTKWNRFRRFKKGKFGFVIDVLEHLFYHSH